MLYWLRTGCVPAVLAVLAVLYVLLCSAGRPGLWQARSVGRSVGRSGGPDGRRVGAPPDPVGQPAPQAERQRCRCRTCMPRGSAARRRACPCRAVGRRAAQRQAATGARQSRHAAQACMPAGLHAGAGRRAGSEAGTEAGRVNHGLGERLRPWGVGGWGRSARAESLSSKEKERKSWISCMRAIF